MDKVRTFFRVMWQQRFWVLTCTALLFAAIGWYMGANDVSQKFAQQKSDIDSKFSAISTISSNPYHGNEDVNRKDAEQLYQLRQTVMQLWKDLYARQRDQVLQWPAVLGADFVEKMEDKQFGDSINSEMRRRYLDFIENRFKGLLDIVKAKDLVGDGSALTGGRRGGGGRGGEMGEGAYGGYGGYGGEGGGYNPGMDAEGDQDYLVQWIDQAQLAQKMQFPGVPSPIEVWVTQEDLWVYETLLKVIAETNAQKGATRPDNTAVRAILSMVVGQEAAVPVRDNGGILLPSSGDGMMGGEMGERGMEGAYDRGGEGGMYSEFGPEGENVDRGAMLLARRYLDETGEPIEASTVEELPPQFRRLPMRMTLMMLPEWIPTVLVECANADLPVEVTRLRINPQLSGLGFSADIAGAGRGGRGEMMSVMPRGGGSSAMNLNSMSKSLAQVEIEGVVYIYNKPDEDDLPQVEGFGEETSDELAAAN